MMESEEWKISFECRFGTLFLPPSFNSIVF
jgi:hypothetical protein